MIKNFTKIIMSKSELPGVLTKLEKTALPLELTRIYLFLKACLQAISDMPDEAFETYLKRLREAPQEGSVVLTDRSFREIHHLLEWVLLELSRYPNSAAGEFNLVPNDSDFWHTFLNLFFSNNMFYQQVSEQWLQEHGREAGTLSGASEIASILESENLQNLIKEGFVTLGLIKPMLPEMVDPAYMVEHGGGDVALADSIIKKIEAEGLKVVVRFSIQFGQADRLLEELKEERKKQTPETSFEDLKKKAEELREKYYQKVNNLKDDQIENLSDEQMQEMGQLRDQYVEVAKKAFLAAKESQLEQAKALVLAALKETEVAAFYPGKGLYRQMKKGAEDADRYGGDFSNRWQEFVALMTRGPTTVMLLYDSQGDAVISWKKLMGTSWHLTTCVNTQPDSLRAQLAEATPYVDRKSFNEGEPYIVDGNHNTFVHGSGEVGECIIELEVILALLKKQIEHLKRIKDKSN